MSEKFKTEEDKDVQEALDKGQPLPDGTIYSPYNRGATGSPLPEGMSAEDQVTRARGWEENAGPHAQKKSAKTTKAETEE